MYVHKTADCTGLRIAQSLRSAHDVYATKFAVTLKRFHAISISFKFSMIIIICKHI